tara:strand:+ start:927 stop:1274 length:348 start_codon:yes stop_codon:yes gene_type:complete
LYISFSYKTINYEGYALEIITQGHDKYLFYIDINVLPRFTKLRHLKNLKDLKGNQISYEEVEKNLPASSCENNLFGYESRPFLEKIRFKHSEIIKHFEDKRNFDENWKLKKYARK